MKAEHGRTYAQVIDGRCHWLFTIDDLPEWNEDDFTVVDVTDNIPSIGSIYNGATFSSPPSQQQPAPLTCTPWQMRKALNQMGLRDAVEKYIAAADQTTKDGWEVATMFVENDPFVLAAKTALGITDEELRNIFLLARTL